MPDYEELSFVIPGHTPDTMPLDRLIEYLQQMAIIIGDPTNLHLVEIRKSSVRPVLRTPAAVALEVRDRALKVRSGQGTKRQVEAYNRVRRMIRRDATDPTHSDRSALLMEKEHIILEIPVAPEDPGVVEGIRQSTTIDGTLIRIGGAGDDAALQIQDLDGRILSGFTAKRNLAKDIALFLWEPVRLMGVGIWSRNGEGTWNLDRMQVYSFEKLEDEDVRLTIGRLRALNVKWPENALERLQIEREGE